MRRVKAFRNDVSIQFQQRNRKNKKIFSDLYVIKFHGCSVLRVLFNFKIFSNTLQILRVFCVCLDSFAGRWVKCSQKSMGRAPRRKVI